jgi:hypothetical protein
VGEASTLIFVSCGQESAVEKQLGARLKEVIEETPGFEAYFAESVQDLQTLGQHVFDGLRRCAGAVVVLQARGAVTNDDGAGWGIRSSVWVNQEVSILAFRRFIEARRIPILAFRDPSVRLEGAMTTLIVNPRPLGSERDVVRAVKQWLTEEEFGVGREETFTAKWTKLSPDAKKIMGVLLDEGGDHVTFGSLRNGLQRRFDLSKDDASRVLSRASLELTNADLAKLSRGESGKELTMSSTWANLLRRATSQLPRE